MCGNRREVLSEVVRRVDVVVMMLEVALSNVVFGVSLVGYNADSDFGLLPTTQGPSLYRKLLNFTIISFLETIAIVAIKMVEVI